MSFLRSSPVWPQPRFLLCLTLLQHMEFLVLLLFFRMFVPASPA